MRYLWQARWTVVKAIFLINRYFVPLTIAFGIYGKRSLYFLPQNQLYNHPQRLEWPSQLDWNKGLLIVKPFNLKLTASLQACKAYVLADG